MMTVYVHTLPSRQSLIQHLESAAMPAFWLIRKKSALWVQPVWSQDSLKNTVAEVLNAMGKDADLRCRRALANSKALSSDVSAAYDPNYPVCI